MIDGYRTQNDNRYLGELFERYIRFVFLVCMKYLRNDELAKDMTMQVFEKLTADLHKFEIRNFKSWLHVTTRNACLMHIRSHNNVSVQSIHDKKDAENFVENLPDLHHDENELSEMRLDHLEKAMTSLCTEQRQCIDLFYIKDKSYKEVTDLTGFTMNEVKSHLQNGKRNLKNYLVTHGEFLLMIFLLINFNK